MIIEKFILPEWALSPLINGDKSGLTSEESVILDDFIKDQVQSSPEYNKFIVTMPEEESYFSWTNDIVRGQGGNVYECKVILS